MDAITRRLASGNRVTATAYKLEVTTPDGQVLTTVDLNDVRQVTRQGATLRLACTLGDITVEMASLDDAGRLQTYLTVHVVAAITASGGTPPSPTGLRDILRWVTGCGGAPFLGMCVLIGMLGAVAGTLWGGSGDSASQLLATR
jgi:hypothetical protein